MNLPVSVCMYMCMCVYVRVTHTANYVDFTCMSCIVLESSANILLSFYIFNSFYCFCCCLFQTPSFIRFCNTKSSYYFVLLNFANIDTN